MFKGSVVWRGIIYALLMMLGKSITGIWLVRFSFRPLSSLANGLKRPFSRFRFFCMPTRTAKYQKEKRQARVEIPMRSPQKGMAASKNQTDIQNQKTKNRGSSDNQNPVGHPEFQEESHATPRQSSTGTFPPKPKSLYPPSILGLAMVARGEVGYLIASHKAKACSELGLLENIRDIFGYHLGDIYLYAYWTNLCWNPRQAREKVTRDSRGLRPGSIRSVGNLMGLCYS